MVAHSFNLSVVEAETGGFLEFEASQVYRASFRTAWDRDRLWLEKNKTKTKRKKKKVAQC